jgi:hypothetical protein
VNNNPKARKKDDEMANKELTFEKRITKVENNPKIARDKPTTISSFDFLLFCLTLIFASSYYFVITF